MALCDNMLAIMCLVLNCKWNFNMSNFISYPQKNLTTFCLLIRVCAHICGTLMHLAILYIYIYIYIYGVSFANRAG